MKNNYLISFFIVLLFTNCGLNNEKEIYFNGQTVNGQIETVDGDTVFNGLIKTYNSNGNLVSSGNYVQNRREGGYQYYFNNGFKSEETNYKNDLEHGIRKLFDSTGKLIESKRFYFGRPLGDLTIYNGKTDTFNLYKFSNFEGTELYSCFWNEKGKIVELGNFLITTSKYYLVNDTLRLSVFLYIVSPPHKKFTYELIDKNVTTHDSVSVFRYSSGSDMFMEFLIEIPKENHVYEWKVDAYYPSEKTTIRDVLRTKMVLPSTRR